MGLRTRPKPRCDHMDRPFRLMGPRPITYLLNHVICLSIFTLELDNEIDREDPIFIENEEVSLAPRTGMTGQRMGTIGQGLHPLCRMRPFANTAWDWVGQRPKALPNPSGLIPQPCPKPQRSMASWPDLHGPPPARTRTIGPKHGQSVQLR